MPFLVTGIGRYLLGAAVVIAAALGLWLTYTDLRHQRDEARAKAAASEAHATIASGQVGAAQSAMSIEAQGVHRDALTITLHEDHAHAIASASGASAPVDPALNDAGRRGLCGYPEYATDPECVRLFGRHPPVLP